MADIETTTVNEEKFHALSRAGDFELSIDATGAEGPTPNEVLVADYASCFTFACRAGAQRELDLELGKVETEAEADRNEDDDLTAISFHMHVEADLDDRVAHRPNDRFDDHDGHPSIRSLVADGYEVITYRPAPRARGPRAHHLLTGGSRPLVQFERNPGESERRRLRTRRSSRRRRRTATP